jgi:hypothetical protein
MTPMPPPMPPTHPQGGYVPGYVPGYAPAAAYPPAYPAAYPPPVPGGTLNYMQPSAVYENVAWREGSKLVVRKGAMLPPLCVRCNEPAEGPPIKRSFSWHSPVLYLLILGGVLVYAIVALIVQQKGIVHLSLCRRHRTRRLLMGWSAAALSIGGLAMLFYSAVLESGVLALGGALVFVIGLVLAVMAQTLSARKIDTYFVWLGGAGESFLANFPPTGRG